MLSGEIHLADSNNTVINITDDIVIANSVSIDMSTCQKNKFDFGTFNAATLSMGIIDSEALNHDFSGALVQLSEEFYDNENDLVTRYLGEYHIDGTTVKRNRNQVTFKAYDNSLLFDIDIPSNVRETSYTAATLISSACTACGVTLYGSIPNNSPNTAVTFTLANTSIQTWRDAVMWACQLIAANAIIDREGNLNICRAWYVYNDNPDYTSDSSDRIDIKFSDTRIYLKYLSAYSGTKVKTYISSDSSHEGALPGEMSLMYNPLLDGKSEVDCDTINAAIISKPYMQRQMTITFFGTSEIALGDLLMLSGGKIDVRRSVRGMATYITWRYHGNTTVTCTAPDAYEETTNENTGG